MSEANRVEELMQSAEPERFDLHQVLGSAAESYAVAFPQRTIRYASEVDSAAFDGAPELLVQLLDKLVDNAVGFSDRNDEIVLSLRRGAPGYRVAVFNPGPPLPDKMRHRLFDSMVSMRSAGSAASGEHLGLGLYIARLIAEGHGGEITADNVKNGVEFIVLLPDT